MGLLPDQFWRLSPGELALLQEHRLQEIERAQELAAFTGYCTAAAVAKWFHKGLSGFSEFYQKPDQQPQACRERKSIEIARKLGDIS